MASITSVFSNQQPLRKFCTRTVPLDRPGPLNTLLNDLPFITDAEKQTASVYLLNPPLNIFELSSENAEDILTFWCKTLGEMNDRGKDGHVCGPLGIPSAYAHLWWQDNAPLSSMIPKYTNLNVPGVHCIVLISPSAKRPTDPESEESPSKRQHVLNPSPLPASDSNESAISDVDTRQRRINMANSLLAALAPLALAAAHNEIHDPSTTTRIPIPTLASLNPEWLQRFQRTKTNSIVYFDYCGRRRVLENILRKMTDSHAIPYPNAHSLAFLGTKGQGRTHISTAAAAMLLSQGLPVVFLPFSPNPRTAEIRDAILVALQNTELLRPYTSELFEYCCKHSGRTGVLKFCNRLRSKDLKLIFVALNLDVLSPTELLDCQSMMSGHDVLFTADGNCKFAQKAEERAWDGWGSVLHLNGGLEQDEVDAWLRRYEVDLGTTLSEEQRHLLLATTGNLPSLLSEALRAAKEKGDFDQGIRSLCPNVTLQMQNHMREVQASPAELRKLLLAVLSNSAFGAMPWLPDRRYMYQDEARRWRYTSLFAYEATYQIALDIQDCFRRFDTIQWLSCIPLVAHNPSMLGYALEYAITSELGYGVTLSARGGSKISIPPLPHFPLPPGGVPTTITQAGLYVPLEFNHRYVDCVAVWFEGTVVHVVPIQISNVRRTTDHSDSRERFFASDWRLWEDAVSGNVCWKFLWIIRTAGCTSETFRKSRGESSTPAHEAFTTGFDNISQKIAGALDRHGIA